MTDFLENLDIQQLRLQERVEDPEAYAFMHRKSSGKFDNNDTCSALSESSHFNSETSRIEQPAFVPQSQPSAEKVLGVKRAKKMSKTRVMNMAFESL